MRDRDDAAARREQALELLHTDLAGPVDRHDLQARLLLLAEQLPRHDVRMVLERGDDDLVAFADALPAEGLGHEVDRLGRAADEDDLAGLGGVDERADLLARLLVGVGRLDRERVHAAVDVRVGPSVDVGDRLDDGLRLLRRRRVVEIDERLAVNRAREDREVAADRLDVEGRAAPLGGLATREDGAHAARPGSRPLARAAADRVAPPRRAERRDADPRGDVAREGVDQEVPGLRLADPARAQVEQRGVVELPDRRAVPALDVVGEDLERRRRVDERLLREEQVLVRLHRVGLLRVRPHDDLAVEDAARRAVHDALVELAARAVRRGVIDHGVVVEVLRAGPDEEAVQRALGALGVEPDVQVVAGQGAAERDRVRGEAAVAPLAHLRGRDVEGRIALALELGVVEDRAVAPGRFR